MRTHCWVFFNRPTRFFLASTTIAFIFIESFVSHKGCILCLIILWKVHQHITTYMNRGWWMTNMTHGSLEEEKRNSDSWHMEEHYKWQQSSSVGFIVPRTDQTNWSVCSVLKIWLKWFRSFSKRFNHNQIVIIKQTTKRIIFYNIQGASSFSSFFWTLMPCNRRHYQTVLDTNNQI